MQAPAAQPGIVPHGWEGWAAVAVILTFCGALIGAYIAWRERVYQKGYRRGMEDQRRKDEDAANAKFRSDVLAEIKAIKQG